jgi:ATP-dependent exoDNAse (exonuclease V) alpha subunit
MSAMGHGPCTFKKRDVKTALKAVRESGVEVSRVEIEKTGKIIIIAGRPAEADSTAEPSEWD